MAHFLIPTVLDTSEPQGIMHKSRRFFAERVAAAAGLQAIQNVRNVPFERPDLQDIFSDVQKLTDAGIASAWGRPQAMPDEPRICSWWIDIRKEKTGGLSVDDDRQALRAAVSEALERHIWKHERDYFRHVTIASFRELGNEHATDPLRFAGYSPAQRAGSGQLSISDTTKFLWIEGYSLTQKRRVLIPAQIVSRKYSDEALQAKKEPFIREPITTGLATHPDRTEAILSGALEIIERDAYMIMWLNRLSLPRITHDSLAQENRKLKELLARCHRYNLQAHFVRLITDAPTYVVMAVVRDPRMLPPVSIGICANKSASYAAEKALLEALRARKNARWLMKTKGSISKPAGELKFGDRHRYWADPSHAHTIDFLTEGKTSPLEVGTWHNDTPREHLQRIIEWCVKARYELISVNLGASKKNVLDLHVIFVIIPEMQPIYLTEARRCEGGDRLRSIPEHFGFAPREKLYLEEPHPFV